MVESYSVSSGFGPFYVKGFGVNRIRTPAFRKSIIFYLRSKTHALVLPPPPSPKAHLRTYLRYRLYRQHSVDSTLRTEGRPNYLTTTRCDRLVLLAYNDGPSAAARVTPNWSKHAVDMTLVSCERRELSIKRVKGLGHEIGVSSRGFAMYRGLSLGIK